MQKRRRSAGASTPRPKRVDRRASRGFRHQDLAWWNDGVDPQIFRNSRDWSCAIGATTDELDPDFGDGSSVLLTEGHDRPVTSFGLERTPSPVVF